MKRILEGKHVFNPAHMWVMQTDEETERLTHEDYMRKCINELTRQAYRNDRCTYYDLLVQLPEWWASSGAAHERDVAENCGIRCIDLETLVCLAENGEDLDYEC